MNVVAVAIGRNEGERLRRCLESLAIPVVYVDSGSTDGSVALAKSLGADVIELDMSVPFTAARARNAGWRRALGLYPATELVQFIDGDCEVNPGWLPAATAFLQEHEDAVVVCGRRRERFPDASIYNRLCDLEWDTPVGPAAACGGDALMRVAALQAVGGYRDSMIAGEEPELCVRLRKGGGQIVRLDQEMTLHDAAMTSFGQWWRRAVRAGHAFAEGSWVAGDQLWRREAISAQFWGLILPLLALCLTLVKVQWGLPLLLLYPVLWLRIAWKAKRRWSLKNACLYATFCVFAKVPQAVGGLRFRWSQLLRRPSRLIEYKRLPVAGGPP